MYVLSDVAVMCAILSGVIAGVYMVCNGTSDGMTGVCVMSDSVLCVMCRGASRVQGRIQGGGGGLWGLQPPLLL